MKSRMTFAFRRPAALALAGSLPALFFLPSADAADRNKANNTSNLNLASSWNTLPGIYDVAIWNSTVTGANTVALGGNLNWQGIKIVDPGGLVTISAGNTLTLGEQGINMSAATQNLTIQSSLALQATTGQVWNIAAGRTLTLNTGTFTRNPYSTLNVLLAGTGAAVATSTMANDATGILGTWATFGTGTSYSYAAVNSGFIGAYGGATAAATAANVTSTSGLLNYNVAAIGALGSGASFNTLRYTGTAGTISGNHSANGILNASSNGALTLSGNLTIGSSRELVLSSPDSTRTLILSGSISDHASGPSAITVGGSNTGGGTVTLSGNSSYTGATTIARGAIILNSNNGLGSTDAGTRLTAGGYPQYQNGGYIELANGVTTAEPIYIDSTLSQNMIKTTGTTGSATLSGPVRMNNSIRPATGFNVNFAGGLSTANGTLGTYILLNGWMTISNQPFINGSGYIAMDQSQTRIIGVAGNMWGGMGIQNGTLRATVPNVFTAATTFVALGGSGPAIFDLAGNSQFVTELRSGGYVVVGQERTVTSSTAADLTVSQTSNVTFDGKFAGAVSLIKNHTGILNLSGPSTTTGGFTVNGGTLHESFGRATSNSGTVSNYLPTSAAITLGGGTFQLSGRADGTTTTVTGTWGMGASEITALSANTLVPGQVISGTGIPSGTYVVSVETGLIGSGNRIAISANTTAGATATITPTAATFTTSQTFAGLTLTPGASGVTVNANVAATPATVLNLGTITQNPGSTVNFTLPAGTQSATNGVTLNNTNTNGILGGWARVGNDWATNSTNATGGNVVALATYTDVNRLGGTLASSAAANVRIITAGASGNITPAATGTTDIHTLLQTTTVGTSTYDPGTTDILRLGPTGGILVSSSGGALTIGTTANDGKLTAGGADNTAGTLYLTNGNSNGANLLTVNSTITDNGSGAVSVTTGGPGVIKLNGTNTYTGRTVVGGTGVYNSTDRLEISSEANLGTTPASFVADQLVLAGGMLRATSPVTLSANRGITVTGSNSQIEPGQTITINGVIAGTGILTRPGQSGSGNLVLNAANTFSGTLVTNSTGNSTQLQLGNVNALQNATLDVSNTHNHLTAFTVAGTNTYNIGGLMGADEIHIGANSLSIGGNNSTTTYSGTYTGVPSTQIPNGGGITGTGGVTKVGTGTLQLSGANTYSGDTRINGGMLVLAHANALQNSTLDTGAAGIQSANLTLLEGVTYNLGGLKGSDDLDMAVCHLSVGANGQSTTFSGALKGAFGNNLTKVGAGTLTLTGANTYMGTTLISSGNLQVGNAGAGQTGTGAVTAANTTTLLGTGVVRGSNFTLAAGANLRPGDTTADTSHGTLTFTPVGTGTHNLAPGSLTVLGVSAATVTVATFGGNAVGTAAYDSWVDSITGTGSHDQLSFNGTTGSTLVFGGNLGIVASSYTVRLGDVFNLLDWASPVAADFTGFDLGLNRDGSGDSAAQFDLPDISSSSYLWDVSRFATSGNIVVIPEPGPLVLCGLGLAGLAMRRRR